MGAFEKLVENNMQGIEAEKAGKVDKAIQLYEENVTHGFDGSHPYKRLAMIYRKQKMYDDEIRVLQKAVEVFSGLKRTDAQSKLDWFNDRLKKAKELKAKE